MCFYSLYFFLFSLILDLCVWDVYGKIPLIILYREKYMRCENSHILWAHIAQPYTIRIPRNILHSTISTRNRATSVSCWDGATIEHTFWNENDRNAKNGERKIWQKIEGKIFRKRERLGESETEILEKGEMELENVAIRYAFYAVQISKAMMHIWYDELSRGVRCTHKNIFSTVPSKTNILRLFTFQLIFY